MPTKLYIGNIPASVSSTELKELFEKYGKVLECDIVKDYAFVVSEDPEDVTRDYSLLPCSRHSIWKMQAKPKHPSLP